MKKRFRKILRIMAWIIASLIVLFILIHTPPLRSVVRGILTGAIGKQIDGSITIGRLNYKLWQGSAEIENIMLELPGIHIKVDRADVSFIPGKGISAKAEHPTVIIRPLPKKAKPAIEDKSPSRFWTILRQLKKVEVDDGRFEFQNNSTRINAAGSISLVRQNLEDLSAREIWILKGDLEGKLGNSNQIPLTIESILELKDDHLHLSQTYLDAGHTSLSADGVLYQTGPFEGNLKGSFHVEDALASSFLLELPVKGTAEGQFQFKINDSGIESSIEFESPQLFVADSGPWAMEAGAHFDGKVIRYDSLVLRGYEGSIETSGSLDLSDMKLEARVKASGLDPNSLVATWVDSPFPLSSQLGAKIQLSLDKWQIMQSKAKGVIRLDSLTQEGLSLSGDVDVELANGEITFSSEVLKMFDSRVSFSGKYQSKKLHVKYELQASTSDFSPIFDALKVSLPQVQTSGYLDATGEVETDFHEISASAQLQSRELKVESDDIELSADLELKEQNLLIKSAEISSGPGKMQIQGQIPLAKSSAHWDLSASLESFDLSTIAEKYGLDVSADGIISVKGPARNPSWSADLQANLENLVHSSQKGKMSVKAHEQGKVITVEELRLDLGEGSVVGSGSYQKDSGDIKGQMSGFGFHLHDILPFIKVESDVSGVIAFDADIQGTASDPNIRLDLNLNTLSLKGSPIPDLSLTAGTDGNTVELKGFANKQFLTASCQLSESFPLRLTVDLSALPINEALAGFPRLSHFIVTSANGQIQMTVPLRDLKALSYQAEVEAIEGTFRERNFKMSTFTTEGDLTSLLVSGYHLITEKGSFKMEGRIPIKSEGHFDTFVKGTVDLEILSLFIPEMSSSGDADLNLHITGASKQPQFSGEATVSKCHGRWRNLNWENLDLQVTSTEDGLQLKTLSVMVLDGSLGASGHIYWTDLGMESDISLEYANLDLASLLKNEKRSQIPQVRISGNGKFATTKLTLAALNGSGQITSINTSLGEPPIALQNPVNWNIKEGALSHSPAKFIGEETDIEVSFTFTGGKTPPDWYIKADGNLSPRLGNILIDESILRLSGKTTVDVDLKNQNGSLSGQAALDGGGISLIDPPLSISKVKVQLSVQDKDIQISELKGQVGTGEINISGQIILDEAGSLPEVNMQIAVEEVSLSLSEGIYLQLSGETHFTGRENYTLSGDIQIPRILVSQELDSGAESLSYLDRQMRSLEEPSFLDRIALDIKADVREFQINTKMLQLSAEGRLSVTGSPEMLNLNGTMRMKQGGYFQLNRARVHITEGSVALDDFPNQHPDINISGFSRVSGIFIELTVRGRTDNLQTQIVAPSRSDLTQGDLVMLLMTGRTSSEAVSSAGTVAAEELAVSLGGLLQEQAGEKVYIDVSPDQSIFSYDSDPTTRFSLGHLVAPNLYVIYSTSLSGTERRAILDYDTRRSFRLRFIYEEDGRNIIELTHRLAVRIRKKQDHEKDSSQTQRKINTVSFEGESPLDLNELQKTARLKPGKKYDYWNTYKGTTRIQEKLVKLGYKSALVSFEERPASPEKVDVVYFLETGKKVNIVWKGDEPGKRLRKRIEALWDGRIAEDVLANILAKQTKYALQAQRYYTAQVSPLVTTTEDEITVRLNVENGPKGKSLTVKFEGNESLPDINLESSLLDPKKPQFFDAIDEKATKANQAIHLRYATEGFIQAQVDTIHTNYDSKERELTVTIAVIEGARALVGAIELPPEVTEATGLQGPEFKLQTGHPFRIEDYVNDRTELNSYYRDQGYIESKISGMLKPADDAIMVIFSVDKGPKPRVGKIRKTRPGKTRLSTIERALTLREGDLIHSTDLARSRKRLLETRVFQSVDIQPVPSEDGPQVHDLVVDITEKPDVEVSYGLRYSFERRSSTATTTSDDYSAFQIGGSFDILNPFGYGHRYGVSGFFFGKEQFFRAFFETESFFGLHLPTQVYLSDENLYIREISNLKSHVQKITFQQYKRWREIFEASRWGEALRLQWNYSFRHIILSPLDEEFSPLETDRGSISLALIGDTRNSFVDPMQGLFWSFSSEFARTWLGSDVNFVKLYGQLYYYVSLGEKFTWASGFRIGAVPGENPLLIIEDRFKAGGPSSVRAFPLNSLGPTNELGEPLGGQAVFIFNQELRFPIYKSFHGGIFYDAGNVFALTREMNFKDIRHCAGLGIRYMLPFGPIRFDWAYILDPKPGETRSRFVFSIGHTF